MYRRDEEPDELQSAEWLERWAAAFLKTQPPEIHAKVAEILARPVRQAQRGWRVK